MGVEQATQLLADLTEALERGGDEPYFLGSVVLVKRKDSADAEVIDGQQRLTTLTILLAVLRDLTTDKEVAVDLEKMIVEPGNRIRRLEPKPRLALRIVTPLADFTSDEREHWTHRLGNLVLLNRAKNSEAQNYDFAEKKARYFTGKNGVASFALTSQVLSQQAWTPALLRARPDRAHGDAGG